MGVFEDLVTLFQTMAACPSAMYCLSAGRLDCAACPVNPMKGPPGLTNSGLSRDGGKVSAPEG